LSLAHELKKQKPACKIIYIGLKGEKVEGLQGRYDAFDEVCHIAAGKFRRYHGQTLVANLTDVKTQVLNSRDLYRLVRGLHSAERIIKKEKSAVVFSKGGFVAVPVGLAARILSVPIVTHDSDTVPGLANRLLGRWAAVRASGMPSASKSVIYTGTPVDERIKPLTVAQVSSFKKQLSLPGGSLVLLAAGGGLGSQQINDLLLTAAPKLLQQFPKLYILHFAGLKIAGQMSLEHVREEYQRHLPEADNKRVQVFSFSADFYKYSGAADLIITRAGATAMSEFALQGKACVVIPSAALAGGHQVQNAKVLADQKAAAVLPADVSASKLIKTTAELLAAPVKRQQLAKNLHENAQPQAAKKLAELILAVAEKE